MIRLTLATLLCAASITAFADERGLRTENRDGDWWRTVDAGEKTVYIIGLRDGALLGYYYSIPRMAETSAAPCRAAVMANFEERRQFLDNVTAGELVKKLDQFYAERANAKVIVPAALFYLSRRAAGDPAAVLDALLGGFRQHD